MKKHLITTYSNGANGEFLINDWLKSVETHLSLDNVDIMVIDFGLTEPQRAQLTRKGVILNQQMASGRMSNVHYSHLARFLMKNSYDQVLYVDCGDLVFQKDISPLFEMSKDQLRLVLEPEFNLYLHRATLGMKDVRKEKRLTIWRILGDQPTANCGFVLGPAAQMAGIWDNYCEFCDHAEQHGTDQLIINTVAYRNGFVALPREYNCVLFLNRARVFMNEEGFYCHTGGVIPVVHNAGRYNWARRVKGFGYRRGAMRGLLHSWAFRTGYRGLDWGARRVYWRLRANKTIRKRLA